MKRIFLILFLFFTSSFSDEMISYDTPLLSTQSAGFSFYSVDKATLFVLSSPNPQSSFGNDSFCNTATPPYKTSQGQTYYAQVRQCVAQNVSSQFGGTLYSQTTSCASGYWKVYDHTCLNPSSLPIPTCPTNQHYDTNTSQCVANLICLGVNNYILTNQTCSGATSGDYILDAQTNCEAIGSTLQNTPTISTIVTIDNKNYNDNIMTCSNGVQLHSYDLRSDVNISNNDLNTTPIVDENLTYVPTSTNNIDNNTSSSDIAKTNINAINNVSSTVKKQTDKIISQNNDLLLEEKIYHKNITNRFGELISTNENIKTSVNNFNTNIGSKLDTLNQSIKDINVSSDNQTYSYLSQDVSTNMQDKINSSDSNGSSITALGSYITSAFSSNTQDYITPISSCGSFHMDNQNFNILGGSSSFDMTSMNNLMNSSNMDTLFNLIKLLLYFTTALASFKVFAKVG